MGISNKQVIDARVEELLFALDMIENNDNPKLRILNKIDDLINLNKEMSHGE